MVNRVTKSKWPLIIELMLDNPGWSKRKLAEEAGCQPQHLSSLTKYNEEFRAELEKAAKERFSDLSKKAIKVLNDNLDEGSLDAAKYVLTSCGYQMATKVEINTPDKIRITIED